MSATGDSLTPAQQDERYAYRIPDIMEFAQVGYDDNVLEYHVWDHAENTFAWNTRFRNELRESGAANVPGEFMTAADSFLHDYNFLKWFRLQKQGNNPYKSPEDLTIAEGSDFLRSLMVDEATIAEWASNTEGTKLGVPCNTIGRFTLCAADLSGTGQDYLTVMKPDTEKLRVEKGNIEGQEVNPTDFCIGALVVVCGYHFVNLRESRLLKLSPSMKALHETRGDNLGIMALDLAHAVGAIGEEAVHNFINSIGGTVSQLWPLSRKAS